MYIYLEDQTIKKIQNIKFLDEIEQYPYLEKTNYTDKKVIQSKSQAQIKKFHFSQIFKILLLNFSIMMPLIIHQLVINKKRIIKSFIKSIL